MRKKELRYLSKSETEIIESFVKELRKKLGYEIISIRLNLPLSPVIYDLFEYKKNKEIGSFAFNAAFTLKKGIKEIYSYDEDFDKIKGIRRVVPQSIGKCKFNSLPKGIPPKEHWMVHLNEVSERRKKKDLLFEERSDEFAFRRNRRRPIFPVVRRPSRNI
jgi:hypothetical protein